MMVTYPNLYHLKYFVDAVSLGSISEAARKNLVTHPAVSRAISSLEKHVGTSLLEHQKKSFKVTKKGYQVAEQAYILLSAAADFRKLNTSSIDHEVVNLKIGISRTLADIYLSSLLQDLRKEFPSLIAHVRFGTTSEIIEAIANRSVDLGLTIGRQSLATLRQTAIHQGEFQLVQSMKMLRGNNERPRPFIITEPRIETERLRFGYMKHFGVDLPVLFEVSSWESIGQLVQKGLGVGLLPDVLINNWRRGSFKILKTNWFECPYEVYSHTLKAQSHNKVLEFAQNSLSYGSPRLAHGRHIF
ncbi:MAG: LysR family transcriptional regulator [Bdellovibrionaceae bacterium]|nr:LysR family transcriptional regulator [Pseudobdellovibrionaceae bacterium]